MRLEYAISDCGTVTIANGVATATSGTTLGNTVTIACNSGYTITGAATLICQAGGYDNAFPTCDAQGMNIILLQS